MDWSVFRSTLMVGELLVVIQGLSAYSDGYFNRRQMLARHGITNGNSFLQHAGIWCDTFLIAPAVAYIIGAHRNLLACASILSALVFLTSIALWGGLAFYFRSLPLPEAHAHDGHITEAGWVHLVFAVPATWVIGLFYFAHPPMHDLVLLTIALTPFFFMGVYKFDREWKWNPGAVIATICGPAAVWTIVLWRFLH